MGRSTDDLMMFWSEVGSAQEHQQQQPAALSMEEIRRIVEEASSGEACPVLPQRARRTTAQRQKQRQEQKPLLVRKQRPASALLWRARKGAWKEGVSGAVPVNSAADDNIAHHAAAPSTWGVGVTQIQRHQGQEQQQRQRQNDVAKLPELALLERIEAVVARDSSSDGSKAVSGQSGMLLALMAALDARVKHHNDPATRERRAAAAVAAVRLEGKDSADVCLAATRLLAMLATGDASSKLVVAMKGGLGALLAALRWHPPRGGSNAAAALARLGYTALANGVCGLPQARVIAVRAGIVRTCAAAVGNSNLDGPTVTAVLNALGNVTVGHMGTKLEVAQRALPAVKVALELNAKSRSVVAAGLRLLHNLTTTTPTVGGDDGDCTQRLHVLMVDSGVVGYLLDSLAEARATKLRGLRRALGSLANLAAASSLFKAAIISHDGAVIVSVLLTRITRAFTTNLAHQRKQLSVDGVSVLCEGVRVLKSLASYALVSADALVTLAVAVLDLLVQRLACKDGAHSGGSGGGSGDVAVDNGPYNSKTNNDGDMEKDADAVPVPWEDLSALELELGGAFLQLVMQLVSTEHAPDSELAAASATERVLRAKAARTTLCLVEGGAEAVLALMRAAVARLSTGTDTDSEFAAIVGVAAAILKAAALEPPCAEKLHELDALAAVAAATRTCKTERVASAVAPHVQTATAASAACAHQLCVFKIGGVSEDSVRPLSSIPTKQCGRSMRRAAALGESRMNLLLSSRASAASQVPQHKRIM